MRTPHSILAVLVSLVAACASTPGAQPHDMSVAGHNVPEMPYCPLVPKDVTATVTATDKGFAVALESKNADVAREILKRANALVGR
jgi:hypothetical protein